ncbi:554_t:CDS:2 [Paraglomus occultum]|uniref:554_t:CDS:1 n=1 Tax=Paraglomus occultum TaxID=144539 RepID=A0A9N9FLT1_9GLOM|nr:554_t:CDS:2 [Paraglomus occultum]
MIEEKTSDSEGNTEKAKGEVKSPSIFNLEQSLMSNLKTLYEKQIACDITITVGKGSTRQDFNAHKCLLCIRSPYFHKVFLGDEVPVEGGLSLYRADEPAAALVLENVSPSAFTIIITYMYTGKLELAKMADSMNDYLQLLSAFDTFKLQEPSQVLQRLVCAKYASALETHFVATMLFCKQHPQLHILNSFIDTLIMEKPESVFDSSDFTTLNADDLISILKRPDLNIPEIVIWDKIIKWAIAQDPVLPENINNYQSSERLVLRDRLGNILPLIKFHGISAPWFYRKIHPYKCVFSEEYYENLLEHYFDPRDNVQPLETIFTHERQVNRP